MAYSDFSLPTVQKQFGLAIDEIYEFFSAVPEVMISDFLQTILRENVPLALDIHTEKARSELIIAPILVELRKMKNRQIGLFSGVEFTVAPEQGLNGVCDFIITRSPQQLFISMPILMLVEAKNENLKTGMAQCMAEMVAAQYFNARDGHAGTRISGVVTTGSNWKFLQLEDMQVTIDQREYYVNQVDKIMAILLHLVS